MKAILRSAIVAAGAASTLVMTTTPASAQTAGAFEGTASIACFGCGTSTGTASLNATGVHDGAVLSDTITATYEVSEPEGATCVVTGTAKGEYKSTNTTPEIKGTFNWTRVGATAVITTDGSIVGGGTAAFAVTSPVGNPCDGPVTAAVVGSVAGT